MPNVVGKLIKDVIWQWWRNFEKKIKLFSTYSLNNKNTRIKFQEILRVQLSEPPLLKDSFTQLVTIIKIIL
jgi:hypothetical protein